MKSVLLLLASLLIILKISHSQPTYKIVYERTVSVHDNLPKGKKMFKSILPEKSVQKLICYFNDEKAKLKELPPESDNDGVSVVSSGMNGMFLYYFNEDFVRQYVNYDNYHYYVSKTLQKYNGKRGSETKKIMGYTCNQVIQNEGSENQMTIWYTKDLPGFASPMPPIIAEGVILEIDSEKVEYKVKSIKVVDAIISANTPEARKISEDQLKDLEAEERDKSKKKSVTIKM